MHGILELAFISSENAWCDEQIMLKWIQNDWNHFSLNLSMPGQDGKILFFSVYLAQQTESVKRLLARCKTKVVNVQGGCTSLVHPVDVSFNKLFKAYISLVGDAYELKS